MITAPASRSRRTTSASARGGLAVGVGAVSGDLAGDVDVVLDRDRHAQQRALAAGAAARVGLVGFQPRALGEHDAEGVQPRIQARDPLEVQRRRARARTPRRRRSALPGGRFLRRRAPRRPWLRAMLDGRDGVALGGPVAPLAGACAKRRTSSPRSCSGSIDGVDDELGGELAGCRCPARYSSRSSSVTAARSASGVDRLDLVVVDGVDRRLRAHHRDRRAAAARCMRRARTPGPHIA